MSLAKVSILGLSVLLIGSCANSAEKSDSLSVPISFEVNGVYSIFLNLPDARTEIVSESPLFFAIERGTSQQLFRAMYDPGRGANRGILLTSIWATVLRLSESEPSDSSHEFERVKSHLAKNDDDFSRNYLFENVEKINQRDWLWVTLKGGISRGKAMVTEIDEEYALIVGVRVFGNEGESTELRDHRIITLRQIVETIQIKPN